MGAETLGTQRFYVVVEIIRQTPQHVVFVSGQTLGDLQRFFVERTRSHIRRQIVYQRQHNQQNHARALIAVFEFMIFDRVIEYCRKFFLVGSYISSPPKLANGISSRYLTFAILSGVFAKNGSASANSRSFTLDITKNTSSGDAELNRCFIIPRRA